ncbi:MAG: hypothetical protein R3330_18320, partial [Saprospiraceae bacterium]|nr:hypothetical protein [Saprospiraceae bacterium]
MNISQDAGCTIISDPMSVSVVPDPVLNVSADDQEICDGGTVTLEVEIVGGVGASTIQWQEEIATNIWQNIAGANGLTYTTDPLSTDTYNYRVQVSQGNGCLTTSDEISINVVPDPTLTISTPEPNICVGGEITISSNLNGGTGPIHYQWQEEIATNTWVDLVDDTLSSLTINFTTADSYTYRLEVTRDAGCDVTSNELTINVFDDPQVTVDVVNPDLCFEGTFSLTANVTGGTGPISYQWQQFVSGSWSVMAGETNQVLTNSSLGAGTYMYRVHVLRNLGCEAFSEPDTIEILDDPTVIITPDDNQICEGGSVIFTSSVSGGTGTTTYQWEREVSPGNWADIPGATADTLNTGPLAAGL